MNMPKTHSGGLLAQLEHLDATQLRRLLVEQLTKQKLGLTWEANAIERDAALSENQGIDAALIDAPLAVDAETPLSELLSHVGQAPCAVPVVGAEHQYVGIISKRMLLQALDREGANNG